MAHMDSAITITITTLVGTLLPIASFVISYFSFRGKKETDAKKEATNMERLSSDIHYIKKSLTSVDEKIDALSKQYSDLLTRVSALETKMKIYHNRED